MCQFLSAIVLKNGDILTAPEHTDSHEDLIAHFNLDDSRDPAFSAFIRVEFMPQDGAFAEPDKYKLTVDEPSAPVWFDSEMREKVTSDLRSRIERMIIREDRAVVLGGCWILTDGTIRKSLNARFAFFCGGTINEVWGGTINEVWGGTINEVWGGTINGVWGGTINEVRGGTINVVRGGTINGVWGGTINEVRGGTINVVRGGTIVSNKRKVEAVI